MYSNIYGKTKFTVAFYGIKDWHDLYIYDNISKSRVMSAIKKDAERIGATAFTLHDASDYPLGHWEKRFGKWYKKWGKWPI